MSRKLLSFVIPAYNEEDCVDALHEALVSLFAQLAPSYDCEAIIVENGSHDTTYEKLLAIHATDPRVKVLKLSRNFMADGGMTAGLRYAKGDAAILMCAASEDPPSSCSEFVKKWKRAGQNVHVASCASARAMWLRRAKFAGLLLASGQAHGQPHPAQRIRLPPHRPQRLQEQPHDERRMLRGTGMDGLRVV